MNRGPSKEEVLIAPLVFWRMSQEPEAVASSCASASCYRGPENGRYLALTLWNDPTMLRLKRL
jgi:hypothetical protein